MSDIVPELLASIQEDFGKGLGKNKKISDLVKKVEEGTTTYLEADEYALEVGEILAKAFKRNISADILPDGKMYYNIAKRILEPTLKNNYDLITEVTKSVQETINKNAGIRIKAIKPKLNQDKVDGLIDAVSSADEYDKAITYLDEPVKNFSQSVVTDSIRVNAEFQHGAGLSPKIQRTATGKCCEWCQNLVGTYAYPDVPREVYQRHDYCRCKVDYVVGRERTNVHNNNTGKRKYVQDEYGTYEKSKEERIRHAEEMKATEKARKESARQKRIATWEEKFREQSVSASDNTKYHKGIDATAEYVMNRRPGYGKIEITDGYGRQEHEKEIKVAEWLHKNLGGDIELLNESSVDGTKMPDYIWRGKYWELKSTTTPKAANSAIRKAIKQIERNPGGIILNYDAEIDVQETVNVIEKRMKGSKQGDIPVDVMIIKNGKLEIIIRY